METLSRRASGAFGIAAAAVLFASPALAADKITYLFPAPDFLPAPGARIIRSDTLRKRLMRVPPETRLPAEAYRPAMNEFALLTDLDALLERTITAHLPAEQVRARRKQAEEQLRPYRARMARATFEQTRDNLLAKLLREDCGVPRLSLFYL